MVGLMKWIITLFRWIFGQEGNNMRLISIEEAIKGLNYQSESDAGWVYQMFGRTEKVITCESVTSRFPTDEEFTCTELDFDERFEHWINTQPQSDRYMVLKNVLQSRLVGIKVFKFQPSRTENFNLDLYVVGITESDYIVMISTSGVET